MMKGDFDRLLKTKKFLHVEPALPDNIFVDVADFLIISDYLHRDDPKYQNHQKRYVKAQIMHKGVYGDWIFYYKVRFLSEVTTEPMSFDD